MNEGAGAAIIADEALDAAGVGALASTLRQQPAWSDFPIFVMTGGGEATDISRQRLRLISPLGAITLIERPLRIATFISSVRAALRSRSHQYRVLESLEQQRRTAAVLADSEARLQFALDAGRLGTWDWDVANGAVACSDQCKAIFGLAPDARFDYASFVALIHPDDHSRVCEAIERALRDESVYESEYRIQSPDGKERWILARGRKLEDSAANSVRMVGVTADISERRTAFERVKLLAGVATDLLRFRETDPLLNSLFHRLSEQTAVDLCLCHFVEGRRLHLGFASGLPDSFRPALEWLNFGDGPCGQVASNRRDLKLDEAQWNDSAAAFLTSGGIKEFRCYPLLANGNLLGTLALGTRRAAFPPKEIELQKVIADQVAVALDRILLIKELAGNNETLAATNAELKRVNIDLEQFAFSASHDLREPLRNLSIYSEILRRKGSAGLDDQARECLSFVLASARRMELLIRDLLSYTQISQNPIHAPADLDPNVALRRVLADLQSPIKQTGAIVHADPLPGLRISEAHLGAAAPESDRERNQISPPRRCPGDPDLFLRLRRWHRDLHPR